VRSKLHAAKTAEADAEGVAESENDTSFTVRVFCVD
jgi:hypothetical protein